MGGQRVLNCSVNFRAGVLSYVEAKDLGARERRLHVWDFVNARAEIRKAPKHQEFPFEGHYSATASVPRPLLRRFVLLKSCSVRSDQTTNNTVQIFDLWKNC